MTITQLRKALSEANKALKTALATEAEVAGMDAAALVEQRVVSEGKKADGNRFSPYSTKKAPAFYYFGRSVNQNGERAVRDKARRREGVSYREFREFNGRNVNVKNFQFTGRMWQGFGVKSVAEIRRGVYRVTLGGKTAYTETLIGYHNKRENADLAEPSPQELQMVKTALVSRVKSIIQQYV